MPQLDDFTRAYLECLLWSETDNSDEDTGGDPLDANYDVDDIHPDSIARAIEDCQAFQDECADLLLESDMTDEQAGHDFLLTRNGHGAGFWDRGLDEIGTKLTAACKPYGSVYAYVGDDGKVHIQ